MDKENCFDNKVAAAVMRTEGVIKVGPMMEERIFDLIGSADLTPGVPCVFTLSLFTQRDRPPRDTAVFPSLAPPNTLKQKQIPSCFTLNAR